MKNARRIQHSERARLEHDLTVTRMGELDVRNMNSVVGGLDYKLASTDAVIIEGLLSTPGAGLSVDLSAPAIGVQNVGDGDVSFFADNNNGSNFNILLSAADPTNPRIDIIEAQVAVRSEFTDTVVDIADPTTKTITPQTRDRDWEIYLNLQKIDGTPAGSPTPPTGTAATAGQITGTVAISGTIDLSSQYILNVSIGVDGEFVEVDCQGATPASTTIIEILAAINGAGFGTIAVNDGSDHVQITAPGTGENSVVKIKQPTDNTKDAYAEIMGGVEGIGYYDRFIGTNAWFKVAEVWVPALATTLSATNVRSREDKDTEWASGAAALVNGFSLEGHRDSVPMDHESASVEGYHLASSALILVSSKLTKYRDIYSTIHQEGVIADQKGRVYLSDVQLVAEDRAILDWFEQEQQYPVSRVDQSQTDHSAAYTVLSTLSEATADKIVFSPDNNLLFASAHSRMGLWISSIGSGYTHLRIDLHTNADVELATQQIAIGDLTAADWNYVDLLATTDVLSDFHYHIYMVAFTGGASPTIGADGSANQSYKQMYKPTAGRFGLTTDDVFDLKNISTGLSRFVTRGSTADDLTHQGDVTGDKSETVFDVMAVDFSSLSDWNAWDYNNYVGVDLKTGRIKNSSTTPTLDFSEWAGIYNTLVDLNSLDAKSILLQRQTQSLEDYLNNSNEAKTDLTTKLSLHRAGDYLYQYNPQVDQSSLTGTNDYTLITSLNEGVAHKLSFIPTQTAIKFLKHIRIGFYRRIYNSSLGNHTNIVVALHDSTDTLIGTVSIPNSGLPTVNGYYWIFGDIFATLTAGETYHYHVYYTGGSTYQPILAVDTASDFSTAQFKEYYGYLEGCYGVAEGNVELVTEAGLSQALSAQEQVYPVSRVDQYNDTTLYSYTVTTALNEGATHKLSFTPDPNKLFSLNHSRLGLYFDDKGSGWTNVKIELHDSADKLLASQTALYANITATSVCWFDLVATLTAGETYHYHIYMEGYTLGVACLIQSGIISNFSGAGFYEMYKPTAGKYGGASEDDVLVMYEESTRSVAINSPTQDDLIFQGDTNLPVSAGMGIMAVDFTLENFDTWEYAPILGAKYIGIDLNTGKIKYPTYGTWGYVPGSTNAKFNTKTVWEDARAIDILRSVGGESIESFINKVFETRTQVQAQPSSVQTVTHGVYTIVAFGTEIDDDLGEFSSNRLTVLKDGLYVIGVNLGWSPHGSTTGYRESFVSINGTRQTKYHIRHYIPTGYVDYYGFRYEIPLNAGDYIEIEVRIGIGSGTLNMVQGEGLFTASRKLIL